MSEADPMRWVWRAVAGGTLVLGWIFILWQNNFHVTVPVVMIGLGYLAVVATVITLWRVGAAAVAPEHEGEEAWTRPIGPRAELEKEKKTLLKAIKEAEFDHAMGKLSKADVDELIRMYRARAIEVIKEIDRDDAGQAEGPRARIEREVQARLTLDKPDKPKKKQQQAKAKEDAAAKDRAAKDAAAKDAAAKDAAAKDAAAKDATAKDAAAKDATAEDAAAKDAAAEDAAAKDAAAKDAKDGDAAAKDAVANEAAPADPEANADAEPATTKEATS